VARPDYYAILGVLPQATTDEIKRAYRRQALECHPDRFPGDAQAAERFRQVTAAYEILGDVAARQRYDREPTFSALDLARDSSVVSAKAVFEGLFGDLLGQRRKKRCQGRDVRYTLTIDLREAVLGCQKTIEFEAIGACTTCSGTGTRDGGREPAACPICEGRGEIKSRGILSPRTKCGRCDGAGLVQIDPCVPCHGQGTRRARRTFVVKVPAATVAGAEKVIAGEGEPGRFGGSTGSLRVIINVRPDPFLVRDGDTLRCDLPVSPIEAALGASIRVPTIDGVATLRIPAGIQSGTKLRMRGLGVPHEKKGRGDQVVNVVVETPIGLSAPAREAFAALAQTLTPESLPRRLAVQEAIKGRKSGNDDAEPAE
jgi:molecular chaperone DnaJ